jgi:hypothetical protein
MRVGCRRARPQPWREWALKSSVHPRSAKYYVFSRESNAAAPAVTSRSEWRTWPWSSSCYYAGRGDSRAVEATTQSGAAEIGRGAARVARQEGSRGDADSFKRREDNKYADGQETRHPRGILSDEPSPRGNISKLCKRVRSRFRPRSISAPLQAVLSFINERAAARRHGSPPRATACRNDARGTRSVRRVLGAV